MITREMRFKKGFILEKIEEVKLKELRIGNFVYSLSDDDKTLEFVEISEIHDDMMYFKECNFDGTIGGSCYPIPLTKDWLIKLGFNDNTLKAGHNDIIWYKDHIGIKGMLGIVKPKSVKYVHQLQNLYFILCGEELTIKN